VALSECSSLGATDFPQHFEAAVKFLPIVRIECKAKRQRDAVRDLAFRALRLGFTLKRSPFLGLTTADFDF
jgi:hypothetical protein